MEDWKWVLNGVGGGWGSGREREGNGEKMLQKCNFQSKAADLCA